MSLPLEETSARNDPVAAEFGPETARLAQGARALLRLGAVARQASDSAADTGSQKEMQRKMLLAMAADLRIVLMRLASRLQTLRWHAETKALRPGASRGRRSISTRRWPTAWASGSSSGRWKT